MIPIRSVFSPGEPVGVDVEAPGDIVVSHLGEHVMTVQVPRPGQVDLGSFSEGSYALHQPATGETTAVQVLDDTRSRLRYGFLASFGPGKDIEAVTRFARRLHLTAVQFYDWAYRHADLMGGGEEYVDALAQPISLPTVRELIAALGEHGIESLGYTAVYAVGNGEWSNWKDAALLRDDGQPWSLADFLRIVDPAHERWLAHFASDLARATSELGFSGFHLDQYGFPKAAVRADGKLVDSESSFVTMIERVRAELPTAMLVFNNVNDFPTWATASSPQDAVYIEPWAPNSTYGALARVVTRARAVSCGKPVVVAAYQSVYTSSTVDEADAATRLTMATLFSHGATQLLAGEAGRVLVDPYYVDNRVADEQTIRMLARWYDFLVANDELLMDSHIVDVTGSYVGAYNGDLDVKLEADVPVSETPEVGTVWRRVTKSDAGVVVHLINLVDQENVEWDRVHSTPLPLEGNVLRLRPLCGRVPRVYVGDPDHGAALAELPVTVVDGIAVAELPALNFWQVIRVLP